MTYKLLQSLVKFSLVGVMNTFVSFTVFNALIFLSGARQGVLLAVITFATYVAGITNSFLLEQGVGVSYKRKRQ